jgi:hypothetical protein
LLFISSQTIIRRTALLFLLVKAILLAVVNAITHINVKPPRLTKQGVVAGSAAAVAVAGGVVLGIRLRFHNQAPEKLA